MEAEPQVAAPEEDRLPFEPRTLLRRLARRWPFYVRAGGWIVAVAVLGALFFGSRTYESEAVLLYVADDDNWSAMGRPPSLYTLSTMVKTQDNLSAVRDRLELGQPLPILGSRFDVGVADRTTVMTLKASSDNPAEAADLANTLAEIFQGSQKALRKQEAVRLIGELETRLTVVREEVSRAQAALVAFNREHGLVDLETEATWHLEELLEVEFQARQAEGERSAIDVQLANLEKTLVTLEERVDKEKADIASAGGGAEVGSRMQQLRQAIDSAATRRTNWAEVEAQETALKRAEGLYQEGLIPEADFERAQADYRRARAKTRESGRVKAWRQELDGLEKSSLNGELQMTKSLPILQGMLLRAFELELERVALEEKAKGLGDQKDALRAKLDALPTLQRAYADLKRSLGTATGEQDQLETQLAAAKRMRDSDASDFAVASAARAPDLPVKSNRKLFFAGLLILGLFGVLAATLVIELLDGTVVSAREAELKLDLPVLGVVPHVPNLSVGDGLEGPLLERFKVIAHRFRQALGPQGGRVLVLATGPGEGASLVTLGLAASLGRIDGGVVVVDGHLRPRAAEEEAGLLTPRHPLEDAVDAGLALVQQARDRVGAATEGVRGWARSKAPADGAPPTGSGRILAVWGRLVEWLGTLPGRMGMEGPLLSFAAPGAGRLRAAFSPAEARPADPSPCISRLLVEGPVAPAEGLGAWLAQRAENADDILLGTTFVGVSCVPQLEDAGDPDLFGSPRLGELFAELDQRFPLVLIDGPPALPHVDAALIARHADAVLLVVGAGRRSSAQVKEALERLATTRVPVIGVILNDVPQAFL